MTMYKKMTRYVRCETCGHHFEARIERCPRCQSNQNAALPEVMADLLTINPLAGAISMSYPAGEPDDGREAT